MPKLWRWQGVDLDLPQQDDAPRERLVLELRKMLARQ